MSNINGMWSYRGGSRVLLWVSLLLVVAVAGVRFSDGSMLLAIARGASVEDPVFANTATQYLWDSPLKIVLLKLLPPKIIVIALVFGLLGILPLAGLLARDCRLFWVSIVAVFLTPAFKVSIQNMGSGDGLIIMLVVFISVSRSYSLIAASFFAIALWHPQQSFFIGLSFLLARYCYMGKFELKELLTVLGSLSVSALIFFIYKSSLSFTYSGREVFIAGHIGEYLYKNLIYAPIAFAPVVAWFLLSGTQLQKGRVLLFVWLFALAFVSFLTTDVTRVMTIISLPIVLVGANKILIGEVAVPRWKFIIGALLIALIPPYSWSGLDYFLWPDLVRDVCKWGGYCL